MGSYNKSKSSKKKSSKIRSQPRKMKRVKKSKSKSKSKTRSSKSKKVGRHRRDTSFDDSMGSQSLSSASNDSYSLYSDSDSMNSEGNYQGKEKVSSLRNKLKDRRKRVGRRSSSSEDSSGTEKRKRYRKKDDSKSSKKSQKYNKSRRNVRHSSTTSGSHDCSTCKQESGSLSEGSKVQKHTLIYRKKLRDKREAHEERVGTKKRSSISPSSSPYIRSREQNCSSGNQDGKSLNVEHKSRYLRSVIIFAEQAHEEEENRSGKHPLKEEIFCDRDDYPSHRSNYSSSRGSKRTLNSDSQIALGDKRQKNCVEVQEICVSNPRAVEVSQSERKANNAEVNDPFLNEVEMRKQEKENGTSGSMSDTNVRSDDLEAVLRRRALENLRKFRGGIRGMETARSDQVNSIDVDLKESLRSNVGIVQRVLPKQNNLKTLGRSTRTTSSTQEVSSPPKATIEQGNTVRGSGIVIQKAIHSSDGLSLSVNSLKEDLITAQASVVRTEYRDSFVREKASSTKSSLNQDITSHSSPNKKPNEDDESEKKNVLKTALAVTSGITNDGETGINNDLSENFISEGQQGQDNEKVELKGGAEFEQKTMSVMRGGEMVQVNYKVYIPKRAPALSRRQLKR